MQQLIKKIKQKFEQEFHDDFILVKAPGRVNLIGEHTDYNEGFVLPAAIDEGVVLAIAANDSESVRFHAIDKEESYEADISGKLNKSAKGWPNYLLGIVDQLRIHGFDCQGFDCVFGGNVPIGAGMSSSAALGSGVLFGLTRLFDWNIPPVKMARIAQKAENEFVGVQCGIMDQFVSLNGKEDHVLKLDCRSLEYEYHPFNRKDIHIVLCDTQVRRELASSEYNVRRSQCSEGVKTLQKFDSDIKSLRDVTLDFLNDHKEELDTTVYRRCKYVIEENKRVLEASKDLQKNDFKSFGQRMYSSHLGLREEYEVSCYELDVLVEKAERMEGVLGARMMGGGFGGCTINLVEEDYLELFKDQIKEHYKKETGRNLKIYQTRVSGGTRLMEPNKVKAKQRGLNA